MADKLLPAVGLEVTAAGAAGAYEGLLGAWVMRRRSAYMASGCSTRRAPPIPW
jgi:hypothetical protein